MTVDNKPVLPKESKGGKKGRIAGKKAGNNKKQTLEHQLRLELMKNCMIYGKSFESSVLYFKSKGYSLGHTNFTELRNELKSAKEQQEWFSREALYVIEDDHHLSVDRIRLMENRLLEEFEAVSATQFYKYVNQGTAQQEIIRNKSHDANLLLRIIAQFQSLQETKTKMFGATPMVQELMEVHRRQEDEQGVTTEKVITTG